MPEAKGKGSDSKHGAGSRKSEQAKPLANPHVTRMKRERRDTEHSDSEIGGVPKTTTGGKAHSIKSGSTHHHKKNIMLENTYKLQPDEGNTFSAPTVRNAALEVLKCILKDQEYDPKTVAGLSKRIVELVKDKTKELNMPRHKIVVHAVVTAKAEQSMKVASRCLWNHSYDSHTSAEYETKQLVGLVTVYGIYYE